MAPNLRTPLSALSRARIVSVCLSRTLVAMALALLLVPLLLAALGFAFHRALLRKTTALLDLPDVGRPLDKPKLRGCAVVWCVLTSIGRCA